MAQQVDGSGRYAEALTPPTSPPTRHTSPMSEMIDNTPPISMEFHEGFQSKSEEKKWHNPDTYYSAPEVVDPHPPQYGQYGESNAAVVPKLYNETGDHSQPYEQDQAFPHTEERRILGMRKRIFYIFLGAVALVVLAVALGAGLGAGLKKKSSGEQPVIQDPFCGQHPELCIGGSLDSRYYSKKGAFNGSGIALAGESWNKGERRIFTLFFQHHTGDVRYMTYGLDQKWEGGNSSTIIATDAKNATAISTVAYLGVNTTADSFPPYHIHLFYISKDNIMKQKSWTNETNKWEEGLVSGMNLAVYDAPSVGMQACWKGNFYGDSDTNKFGDGIDKAVGMNLWFPSDDSTFQQYAWYKGSDKWERLNPWQGKNVYAGVGCYSWEEWSTTSYTMMVDKQNVTEIWWRDTDTGLKSEDSHPINSWTNSTAGGIANVYPSTSMGYTNYLYMQMADKSVKGYNISYTAETTSTIDDITITDPAGPALGLGGTHLTCTSYALKETKGNVTTNLWDSLYVFYQTKGDDITAFTRPFIGGQWTAGSLVIPED